MKITAIILLVLAFFGYHPTPTQVHQIDATIQAAHDQATSSVPAQRDVVAPQGESDGGPTEEGYPSPFTPLIIIVPTNEKTMPEEVTPAPAEATPEPVIEAPVAVSILAENVSKRPAYSNCYGNPVQTFWVRVFDKDGKAMQGQAVHVESTVEGFVPFNMITDLREQGVGALLNVTMKGIEEGDVTFTFRSGSLSTPEQVVHISKVSDADRPAYCDPLERVSIEDSSNTPPLSPLAEARANAQAPQEPTSQGSETV